MITKFAAIASLAVVAVTAQEFDDSWPECPAQAFPEIIACNPDYGTLDCVCPLRSTRQWGDILILRMEEDCNADEVNKFLSVAEEKCAPWSKTATFAIWPGTSTDTTPEQTTAVTETMPSFTDEPGTTVIESSEPVETGETTGTTETTPAETTTITEILPTDTPTDSEGGLTTLITTSVETTLPAPGETPSVTEGSDGNGASSTGDGGSAEQTTSVGVNAAGRIHALGGALVASVAFATFAGLLF